jgi:tetratricopeptide (TPR) repeat protein
MQHSWRLYLKRGRACLSRHDPHGAIKSLEKALDECPVERSDDLSAILYLCGVAFMKIGRLENARECWYSAAVVKPGGTATQMVRRSGNSKEEEWYKFKSIQLARYFSARNARGFFSDEERNRVLEVISVFWEELLKSGILEITDRKERECLFKEVHIDYGTLTVLPERPGACRILKFE